jgi:hypothetical protein
VDHSFGRVVAERAARHDAANHSKELHNETIFPVRRNPAETQSGCNCDRSDNGVDMLDIIISLFYRQSCKASLSAIRLQKHLWA